MIRATELHGLTWRKSSLSDSGGSNCVEVASTLPLHWRTSTFSDSGGSNCVEVASTLPATWRTSSLSASGGSNCVEVAGLTTSHTIAIRDSKNPDGPALLLTHTQWHGLINASHTAVIDV